MLPTDVILPIHSDFITSGNKNDLEKYLREFVFSLQEMYSNISQAINGTFRNDFGNGSNLWVPVLDGETTSGTFTYTHQSGYVYRQGILVDVWFDVQWSSAGTAAGDLYLILPYKVALVNQIPFVGLIQSSILTYTAGTSIHINGETDTYKGKFYNSGSGFTTATQQVVASGRLIGHLRYIGTQNER